jgi:hypothetical protein
LDGLGDVILNLTPDEYQAMLCGLEAALLSDALVGKARQDVQDVWERLLVDGGHVTVKGLTELRKLVK